MTSLYPETVICFEDTKNTGFSNIYLFETKEINFKLFC